MKDTNKDNQKKEELNTGKELKKWETPVLYQEDISVTKGGTPLGPTENSFYHT